MENKSNWIIGIITDERDLLAWDYKDMKPDYKFQNRTYHQSSYKDWKNACTIIACITAITNNCNVILTDEEINEIIKTAKENRYNLSVNWELKPFDIINGWYTDLAWNHCRKWLKEFKNIDIIRKTVDKSQYQEYWALWYLIHSWFSLLVWMYKDKNEDCIMWNDEESWEDFSNWHSINFTQFEKDKEYKDFWVDNYPKYKCNLFEIIWLEKNQYIHNNWYICNLAKQWLFIDVSWNYKYYEAVKFCLDNWIMTWYGEWESKTRRFWVNDQFDQSIFCLVYKRFIALLKKDWKNNLDLKEEKSKLLTWYMELVDTKKTTRWELANLIFNIK